ncbi:beta-lactamase family protein [Agromyces sp. ISL-38]|uniref:serine hydrolase domain-containing protein n=1 Tax=Agromyces sp. ISL-38 TaxID=2819107 RepID=UPI001BE89CE6|nr:serine hydrolase domain-containing protein [Agromyces sp. ISL-38]MBT2497693.1 beta-lactamase family protein [Agromyces sp. ISL-38]
MADRLGKRRRRSAFAAVIATTLVFSGCTGGAADPGARFDQVDAAFGDEVSSSLEAVLDEAVALSGSSGGVAGVWAPWAGEWSGASGALEFTEGAPAVASETRFRIGTLTTEITCTILLRLVDAGKVALDDEVGDYVEWIPDLDGINLEQLCRHTSGIADYYPPLRSHFVANPERVWPSNELLSNALAMSRVGPPGEQWSQSRSGILLLGMALERATNRSWADLAKQYVFDPLGLESTGIPAPNDTDHDGLLGAYSASIAQDGTVDCAVLLDDSSQSSSMGGVAAGAVSNLEDMRKLSEAFATGVLLDEGTVRRQWSPTPMGGDTPAWQAWGLGGAQYGSMRGTAGETAGALTAGFTDPASGLTVVVALNNSTSGADFVREVAFALASIASKAEAQGERERPLVELPWSIEQATENMRALAKCPRETEAAPAGG